MTHSTDSQYVICTCRGFDKRLNPWSLPTVGGSLPYPLVTDEPCPISAITGLQRHLCIAFKAENTEASDGTSGLSANVQKAEVRSCCLHDIFAIFFFITNMTST